MSDKPDSSVEGLPVADINFTMYPDCVDIHYSAIENVVDEGLTLRLTRAKFRRYMEEMKRIEAYYDELEDEPLADWERELLEGTSE